MDESLARVLVKILKVLHSCILFYTILNFLNFIFQVQGVMLIGTSILGKPLECTYCGENSDWICSSFQQFNVSTPPPDPEFNQFFIPRYCHKQMSDFILYMPFILILLAGFLILCDRPIDSYLFKSFDEDKVYQTAVIDLQDLTHDNRTKKVN